MKKLFLLLVLCSYAMITNAQTFYVVNNTNYDLDVTRIWKFNSICASAPNCTMSDMLNIASNGGVDQQAYPGGCPVTNPNISMAVELLTTTFKARISCCGTDQFNVSTGLGTGEVYDLYLIGAGPDVMLEFH